jgi:AraC family transcriptional regulator
VSSPLLSPAALNLLLAPECWRLISHAAGTGVAPVSDPRHLAWMAGNTHAHPYREVLFVLGGEGSHGYRGEVYSLGPGVVFVFGSGEPHDSMWPDFAPAADHLWIGILGDHFIARALSVREGRLAPGGWQEVLSASEAGLAGEAAFACPPLGPPALRQARLRGALELLLGALAARCYDTARAPRPPEHEGVMRALAGHIQETAGAGLTMDTLARLSGYSKFHFQRLFRQSLGLTVHAYVDVCRLERARQLQAAGQTQAQVAQALGFSCPAAFSRWYRPYRTP